jgi:hypothetical protein
MKELQILCHTYDYFIKYSLTSQKMKENEEGLTKMDAV